MFKWIKENWITIVICSVFSIFAFYYINRSREGFQTESPDTPAACAMMNVILESSNKRLQEAIKREDKNEIKSAQTSYDSILAEKNKMIC